MPTSSAGDLMGGMQDLTADTPEPPVHMTPIAAPADLGAQIDNAFRYHAPKGDQPQRYELLRKLAKELATLINQSCPHSRERSLAITNLENCVM